MIAIGIAGASGSGKSLVAQELARSLPGCGILCTDSYYRDLSGRSPAERERVNFDHPAALDWTMLVSQCRQLRNGRRIAVPRYDFRTHIRLPAPRELGPVDVLVLEGLFALSDAQIRSLLDLSVFVDTQEAVCLARRIERDTAHRGCTDASVREQWRSTVLPMFREHVLPTRRHATLVIDGAQPPAVSARKIVRKLREGGSLSQGSSLHSGI